MIIEVSHTTDDLVFEWFPVEDQPLVVEPLQLPQVTILMFYLMMMMRRRIYLRYLPQVTILVS